MSDDSDFLKVIGFVVILSLIVIPWAVGAKNIVTYLADHKVVAR